jgi:hypothetical protein
MFHDTDYKKQMFHDVEINNQAPNQPTNQPTNLSAFSLLVNTALETAKRPT